MGRNEEVLSKCSRRGVNFLMIFVLLGTQDNSFERLLKELDKLKKNKIIKEKIIVQAGHT